MKGLLGLVINSGLMISLPVLWGFVHFFSFKENRFLLIRHIHWKGENILHMFPNAVIQCD